MAGDSRQFDVYRFADCELRSQTRELLRDGEFVAIEPRAFDLLEHLLKNRSRVVSKDEIHESIWPGTYVSEASLSRCVMKARRSIGDDADGQHMIKTVRGRGYRFVAELSEAPKAAEQAPAPSSLSTHQAWHDTPRFQVLVVAGALALLVLLVLLFL